MRIKELIFISISLWLGCCVGEVVHLRMNREDIYSVDLTDLIDYRVPLNDLSADVSDDSAIVRFNFPSTPSEATCEGGLDSLRANKVHGLHVSEGKAVVLFADEKGSQRFAVYDSNFSNGPTLRKTASGLISSGRVCGAINFQRTTKGEFIRSLCIEEVSSVLKYCEGRIDSEQVNCIELDESHSSVAQLRTGKPRIVSAIDQDSPLVLVYLAEADNEDMKDVFWAITSKTVKVLRVPRLGFALTKIEISRFSASEDIMVLLLMGTEGETQSLYSLKIEEGHFRAEDLIELRKGVAGFAGGESKLVTAELEGETMKLAVNLADGTLKIFEVPEVKALGDLTMRDNFAVVSVSGARGNSVVVVDLNSQLHYVLSLGEGKFDWMGFGEVQGRGVLLGLEGLGFRASMFGPQAFATIEAGSGKSIKTLVQFLSKGKSLMNYAVEFLNFEDVEIEGPKTVPVGALQESGHFIPSLRANNPTADPQILRGVTEVDVNILMEGLRGRYPLFMAVAGSQAVAGYADGSLTLVDNFENKKDALRFGVAQVIHQQREFVDFNKVTDSRVLYGRFLALLTDDGRLATMSLAAAKKIYSIVFEFHTLNSADSKKCDCRLSDQGVLCLFDYTSRFFAFEVDLASDILELKPLPDVAIHHGVFNVPFERSDFAGLARDSLTGRLELLAWDSKKASLLADHTRLHLAENTKVEPSAPGVLLVLPSDPAFASFVLHGSVLALPLNRLLPLIDSVVSVSADPVSGLFALLYQTSESDLRAAVLRPTLDPARRLVADWSLSANTCTRPRFDLRREGSQQLLVIFSCAESKKLRVFTFAPEGPIFQQTQPSGPSTISVNGQNLEFNFEKLSALPTATASLPSRIYAGATGAMSLEPGTLKLNGDVLRLRLATSQTSVSAGPRPLASSTLLAPRGATPSLELGSSVAAVTCGDKLLLGDERATLGFEDCLLASRVLPLLDERMFYLCRLPTDRRFVLIDREGLSYEFPAETLEPSKDIERVFLIRSEPSSMFLVLHYKESNVFKLISLALDSRNHSPILLFEKTLVLPDIVTGGRPVAHFSVSFESTSSTCHLMFLPFLSSQIYIRSVFLSDLSLSPGFEPQHLSTFSKSLPKDAGLEPIFYSGASESSEDGGFRLFVGGRAMIFEFKITRSNGAWTVSHEYSLQNPYGNKLIDHIMVFNKEHLAIVQPPSAGLPQESVLIFSIRQGRIIQSISSSEFGFFNYRISEIGLITSEKESSQLIVSLFDDSNHLPNFSTLKVLVFSIGSHSLNIDTLLAEDIKLTLNVDFANGETKQLDTILSFKPEPFNYLLYLSILALLMLALIVTASFGYKFYEQTLPPAQNPLVVDPLN